MQWIFHGSSVGNINIIEPRVSEHGQAYVYGVPNRNDALWYCADHKGFLLLVDENMQIDESKVKAYYQGKRGYIYRIDRKHFEYNPSIKHWVSLKPVPIFHCEKVEDIYIEITSHPELLNLSLEQISCDRSASDEKI